MSYHESDIPADMLSVQVTPPRADIYPALVMDNMTGKCNRECAKWDGNYWSLWWSAGNPPHWSVASNLSCRVLGWRTP